MTVQDSMAGFRSILQLSLGAGEKNSAAGQMVAVNSVDANKMPTQFAHACTFSANLHPDLDQKICVTRCSRASSARNLILALRSHCRYCELDGSATGGCISCCMTYQECIAEVKCTASVSGHVQDPTRTPQLAAVFWSSIQSFTAAGTTLDCEHMQVRT